MFVKFVVCFIFVYLQIEKKIVQPIKTNEYSNKFIKYIPYQYHLNTSIRNINILCA